MKITLKPADKPVTRDVVALAIGVLLFALLLAFAPELSEMAR